MNKEVKTIVEYLEENREQIQGSSYYPDDVLTCKDLIMLMDYIKQLEEEIKKLKNMYNHHYKYASDMEGKYVMAKGVTDWLKIWLEEMLDKPNDIFSVVRVKDVLDKIKELEGGSNE